MTASQRSRATARGAVRMILGALTLSVVACSRPRADAAEAGSAAPLHLRVIATHDLHGALEPTPYVWSNGRRLGGMPALKAVVDSMEASCACPTIRVDGGDQMQGTLESNLVYGASAVAAFNLLGLDVAAIGNHELDWGVDTLVARQRDAHYPWLAANIFLAGTNERPEWARPYAMVERAGVLVGVIGYTTASAPRSLRPATTEPYDFRRGYEGIRDALDSVLARDPDFVVVVAHAAGDCMGSDCRGEMVELAEEIPTGSVDLIAAGHAHDPGQGVVHSIPIVRAGSSGRAVAAIDLYRLDDGSHAFRITVQLVNADEVSPDTAMVALLAPYIRATEAQRNTVVTTLAQPLDHSAAGDRHLGDFIAEAARLRAGADVGMHNPGGVRADLPRGPVTYADLSRVLPFGNQLVRLTLSGRQLRDLVALTAPRYYFANLRVEGDPRDTAGGEPPRVTLADGTTITDSGEYTLALPDFLAVGGDGLAFLAALPREEVGVTILEAVIGYLQELPAPVVIPHEGQ